MHQTSWQSGNKSISTDLSGPVAEGLSHANVTHSWRTGGLTIIQCLSSLGCPGNKKHAKSKSWSQYNWWCLSIPGNAIDTKDCSQCGDKSRDICLTSMPQLVWLKIWNEKIVLLKTKSQESFLNRVPICAADPVLNRAPLTN